MLRSAKDLEGSLMSATDGDVGKVTDLFFDDQRWAVRYLVTDTSGFLNSGRTVLLSPMGFSNVDWANRRFRMALTKDKVDHSPDFDLDKPVYRQHELAYHGYYGYPFYWGGSATWGTEAYPGTQAQHGARDAVSADYIDRPGDVHLRSMSEVRGYHIQGTDDAIGHVKDFIIDDSTWKVRYLVVNTSNWWVGKSVLVAPEWATSISWEERKVHVAMSRETIKNSPEWNQALEIERAYEARLYDYYGCPIYWNKGDRQPLEPTHRHVG